MERAPSLSASARISGLPQSTSINLLVLVIDEDISWHDVKLDLQQLYT